MAWTTPRTWNPFELVTDTMLNLHVRDNLTYLYAFLNPTGPTAYAPVWIVGGVEKPIGNGSLTASYVRVGRMCHVWIQFTFGSTSAPGAGDWGFSLPFQSSVFGTVGSARIFHSGVAFHVGAVILNVTTYCQIVADGATGAVSNVSPFAWGAGDALLFNLAFPALD